MTPAATIVIPTYNRAGHLSRTLSALEEQDVPAGTFDVVVVDDGSDDATPSVLSAPRPYALRSLRQRNQGPGAARNAAISDAEGDILVFLDDDVIPAPDLVWRHLEAQQKLRGVVIGRMDLPAETRQPVWAEWEGIVLQRQYDEMIAGVFVPTARQFYTANASVPREDVIRAGMFDETFRRAEDVELAYRLADLGLPFRFLPEAIVVHDTPRSFESWTRMAQEYGRYDVIMWRERGRAHVLSNIAEEQQSARKPAIRRLGRAVAGRSPLVICVRIGCSAMIRVRGGAAARKIGRAACSALFNVLYLHGACTEFGGRQAFWSAIDAEQRHLAPAQTPVG